MLVSPDWIKEHEHDLDGWVPKIEIIRPGFKQTITIRSKKAMAEVVKVIRENKRKECG